MPGRAEVHIKYSTFHIKLIEQAVDVEATGSSTIRLHIL